jgi:hypothetical protein
MAKAQASLEEGLNNSANKRGLSGAERHRYIGGALHNMGKARTRSGKREPITHHKAEAAKPAPKPKTVTRSREVKRGNTPEPGRKKIATPQRYRFKKPAPKPRERLELSVKVNKEASEKVPNKAYSIYSIYKGKERYNGATFRSMAKAKQEAKIIMDAHNHPQGEYKRGTFF